MLNELSEHDAMELKARLDEARLNFERGRNAPVNIAVGVKDDPGLREIHELLERAVNCGREARELHRNAKDYEERAQKVEAEATNLWNAFMEKLLAYGQDVNDFRASNWFRRLMEKDIAKQERY